MTNIFILNDYETSLANGIGAYINQLTDCFADNWNININIIDFYSFTDRFCIKQADNITRFCFPKFEYGVSLERINKIIDTFFKLYIPDSPNNIFFINHCPNSNLMRLLRSSHPKSKLIYIVHNMGWTSVFKGDSEAFKASFDNGHVQDERIAFIYREESEMCTLADKIVCLSRDTFYILESYYPTGTKKLVHINSGLKIKETNTIDKDALKDELFLSKDEITILYVGRISELKGAIALVEAFKKVVVDIPNCRLAMIGSAQDWEDVLKHIYPVSSKIILTGVLDRCEINKWYHVADIGVIPSYTEQCSYVALEMLSHGLPVVSSDGFGVKNMFVDGYNGVIARIGNRDVTEVFADNLASEITRLAESDFLRKHYKDLNQKIFEQSYTFSQMKEKYTSLLEDLVKSDNKD